jgi:hypothetical protein
VYATLAYDAAQGFRSREFRDVRFILIASHPPAPAHSVIITAAGSADLEVD